MGIGREYTEHNGFGWVSWRPPNPPKKTKHMEAEKDRALHERR